MSPSAAQRTTINEDSQVLIADILSRIKNEADAETLNAYRAFVRKNVPFFMRSYFAAYLFMSIEQAVPKGKRSSSRDRKRRGEVQEKAPSRADGRSKKGDSEQKTSRKDSQNSHDEKKSKEGNRRSETPRRFLPESEAATLFVSAGRNRRAYARELLSLITSECGIDTNDVGELRVLDHFSFVQVRKPIADAVIEKLNGVEFRGRALSVSYAKPRKELSSRDESSQEDSPAFSDGGSESVASEDDKHDAW